MPDMIAPDEEEIPAELRGKPGILIVGMYAGDVAEVQAPGGVRSYEILDVKSGR